MLTSHTIKISYSLLFLLIGVFFQHFTNSNAACFDADGYEVCPNCSTANNCAHDGDDCDDDSDSYCDDSMQMYNNNSMCVNTPYITGGQMGNDCNDNAEAINPETSEVCRNTIDDNCNSRIDEDCRPTQPTTLSPTNDSYVRGGTYAGTNYGGYSNFVVKRATKNSDHRAYLRFDLSGVSGSVGKATLKLYGKSIQNRNNIEHALYFVNSDSWQENSITYSNKPAHTYTPIDYWQPVQGQYVEVNVTEAVRSEANGDNNVSFMLWGKNDNWAYNEYYSSEDSVASRRPVLLIEGMAAADNTAPVVTNFTINDTSINYLQSIHGSYTATEETGFNRVEIWRAPDSGGSPGTWTLVGLTKSASGLSASGSFRDTPPSAGAYWYGIHAVDSTGNRGKEPNPPGPVKVNVAPVASKVTANPNASAQTVKLLNYFKGLSGRSTKRVLSGHSFGDHVDEIVPLFNQTGKWPAIIGADPYWYCAKCLEPEFTFYNPIFINHWNNGGLITLHIHPGNPEQPGVTLGGDIDIEALLTPGTAANLLWMNALKLLADGLEELQDAGVVVLWRPFHEMCGGFWWGMNNDEPPEIFSDLWKHMFEYFTYDRKLNNLLWVFTSGECFDTYYPGDNYVDINGGDSYTSNPAGMQFTQDKQIAATGKPFAYTEFGPYHWSKSEVESKPPFDLTILRDALKNELKDTDYFLNWQQVWSMMYHDNADVLLNDPIIVNRGDITFFN